MLCYLTILLISLHIHYSASVFNFEELQSLHYGIDISDTPLLRQEQLPSDAVVLSSKYGQLYQCSYPPAAVSSDGSQENSQSSNLSVVELLAPMKLTSCLIFTKGWWTYEFCFGRELKQYHAEDGKVVGDVLSLGYFEKDINSSAFDAEKFKSDMSKHRRHKLMEPRYHKQTYVNGTHCDLTGKARSTEARFVCQEGHGDYVAGIDERETCSYVVTVHTSRICSHPQFGPLLSAQSVSITCSPLLSSSDYENYIKDSASAEVQQNAASSLSGTTDPSSAGTSNVDEEKTDSSSAGSDQKTDLQNLFINSLVNGVRAAMGDQEQGQVAPDTQIKFLNDPKDLDSIIKSMLLGEEEQSEDKTVVSADTPPSNSDQSVNSLDPVDSASSDEDAVSRSATVAEEEDNTAENEANEEDEMDEEDKEFLQEFDTGLDKIAETVAEKARIAKYKENLHSAMNALLPDLIQEGRDDMARQGEDAAIDAQVAFRKLSKTLNGLIQRLEHAGKELDDDDDGAEDTSEKESNGAETEEVEKSLDKQASTPSDQSNEDDVVLSKTESTSSVEDQATTGGDSIPELNQPLVDKLKDRLKEAGLTTAGRKVEFRIITAGYYNKEDGSLQSLSDDDSSTVNKMIIAIIGDGNDEETKELERQQRLEDNYHFKYMSPSGGRKQKHDSDREEPGI